ncbi:DUF1700 domain-containing protein [Asticcacaulis benevestitus]|uniref:DUF1700 domain-containing protein n=1 Tax=Asticcacaulis benevestitus DSM 16100 = ATCC BAA-896 TaxID=1121022 RepID=V4Q3E5_9CAUL|nr:DUF1700 domain-containing protein [Asticcacaulis benevestitus]ESQ92380.1 hypothetical protein ABENE_08365 [Asticcacaulis benevestitus DSM 16100 = ATCC BAA-896]
MTRIEFLDRLCKGLTGLPPATLKEIMADYEAHFKDAAAEGRSESEVAAALGDPERLARELKAEAGVKSWDEAKTPSNATAAIVGILGLGALDILILLPLLGGVVGTLIGIFAAAIGGFIAGGVVFAAGPFLGFPGGIFAALLGGFGVMLLSAAVGAITLALTIWMVNGVVWFARLHYRVLKPALES